jgi:hypothetical protein
VLKLILMIYMYSIVIILLYIHLTICINVINQIAIANSSGYLSIQLKPNGKYKYLGMAFNGHVFQTSWVFSHYDYAPANGMILNPQEYLTDSKARFVYKTNLHILSSQIDKLEFFNIETFSITYVHILPKSKQIVSSNFLLGDESWIISGSNPLKPNQIKYWTHNSGFITGTETYINVDSSSSLDKAIWYFKAPEKYYRDLSIVCDNSGTIEFELVALAGDFNVKHFNQAPIIKLSSPDLSVRYFLPDHWDGIKKSWTIRLVETNFLPQLSPGNFIKLLTEINSIEILGDWTSGYETIGLSWVQIRVG